MRPDPSRHVAQDPAEKWLADEMLGRLARFLRMMGLDTDSPTGLSDDALRARAQSEGRTLLTRDAALARRTPGAVRLHALDLAGQLREFHQARPSIELRPRFDRCTKCNGELHELSPTEARAAHIPDPVIDRPAPAPMFQCGACGQAYWEGSHTDRIRQFLDAQRDAENL